jgi:hypothetical protein
VRAERLERRRPPLVDRLGGREPIYEPFQRYVLLTFFSLALVGALVLGVIMVVQQFR